MNKLAIISAVLVLAACSQTPENDAERTTAITQATEQGVGSDKPTSPADSDNPKVQYAGTWACAAVTCAVDTKVDLQADGRFKLWIGEAIQEGTWDLISPNRIFVKSATLENGQEWEVRGHSDSTLNLCWNPDSKDPKIIPFKKQ
jgi:hypothetical protein